MSTRRKNLCADGALVPAAVKLEMLRVYFGGHEQMQDAIFFWRLHQIAPEDRERALGTEHLGLWIPKLMAVGRMYDQFIVKGECNE